MFAYKPAPLKEEMVEETATDPTLPDHIKVINHSEHLQNLEMMCKADRAFMKRVKEFCEEHKEENFPNVPDASESPSEHRDESE